MMIWVNKVDAVWQHFFERVCLIGNSAPEGVDESAAFLALTGEGWCGMSHVVSSSLKDSSQH